MSDHFRMFDTKRAQGVYVTFARITPRDEHAHPSDYLFQDETYREEDQARLEAWQRDDWQFVGVQAVAEVLIIRDGHGTRYSLTSPGIWGVEDDAGEDYLASLYADEVDTLKADILALAGQVTFAG